MYNFLEMRKAAKLTQTQLADLIGCTQATIARIEQGKSSSPVTTKIIRETLDRIYASHKEPNSQELYPPSSISLNSDVREHPPTDDLSRHPPGTELNAARAKIAQLEDELREAHKTISNLSDALAAGLGRARALRPPTTSASNARYGGKKHTA